MKRDEIEAEPRAVGQTEAPLGQRKNPWTTVLAPGVFSFLVPGTGKFYKRKFARVWPQKILAILSLAIFSSACEREPPLPRDEVTEVRVFHSTLPLEEGKALVDDIRAGKALGSCKIGARLIEVEFATMHPYRFLLSDDGAIATGFEGRGDDCWRVRGH